MALTAPSLLDKDISTKVLSKREFDVLHLLSQGHTNDQIAEKLCISYHTVANHKRNMADKLQLKSSQELLPFALSHYQSKQGSNNLLVKNTLNGKR
jgi:DNA-binding CsgD family transcriptional regulator